MKKNLNNYPRSSTMLRKVVLLTCILWLGIIASAFAQKNYVYSGVVTDKQGETMPGVSIIIKGTTDGTSTDINGKFTLNTTKPTETLVFSFVGKIKQEILAAAGVPLNIVLEEERIDLEGVVVIGYGTQKKSVVTGAISSVKSKDLENAQIVRVEQALQGRTSGISVTSSSGSPGASSTIRVRGVTTINDSDPLYIVDGVVVDNGGIDYLNSADISSIEVLKDAASQAIYGARAANGVILITTKKGQTGKMNLNYNTYFGIQSPAQKLDMLNAKDYATLLNESRTSAGMGKLFDPDTLGAGTDWQSTIFNENAGIQNHELSLSGGNEKATIYTSLGYFDQKGIVATDISNYKRVNLRLNATYNVNKWLRMGNNFGYSHIKSQGSLNTNSEYGGPLSSAINLDPVTPTVERDPYTLSLIPYTNPDIILSSDGYPYGISTLVEQEMSNPLAYIQTRHGNYGWSDNFVGDFYAEIEPIKGLVIKSDAGAKLAFWGGESFSPISYLNASSWNKNNSYNRDNNRGFRWSWENIASYRFAIDRNHIMVMLGVSAYVNTSRGISVSYKNLPVNSFEEASMNYSTSQDDITASGWESPDEKTSSTLARVIYDYDEKYLFTGIVRRDGSSKFGSNKKFGYFPSASLGWVATRENFFPQNDVLTFLKIRGSYGVVGNDRIGNFRYISTIGGGRNYTFGYDNYVIGYSPNAPANPDLQWEETTQTNVGFEATLFDNFTVVFDYFSKNTTGMLMDVKIPDYVGAAGNPVGNVAAMTNNGLELELGYRKQIDKVYFDIKANGSYIKNEVTDIGQFEFLESGSFQSSQYNILRTEVGQPYNSFYGYEILGIFQTNAEVNSYSYIDDNGLSQKIQPNAKAGDFKYADRDGDGKITESDRTFIGNQIPTWTYGFTASANYMGFDVMLFCQGVAGNKVYNAMRRLDIANANWTSDALGRWTGEGTSDDYPRLIQSDPNKNFSSPSEFFLTSGTYFRIKTLQFGYTLPVAILEKAGISQLRFYVSSNNLATFTKYNGFDPEIGGSSYGIDRGVYPQARSFLLGVNLTF